MAITMTDAAMPTDLKKDDHEVGEDQLIVQIVEPEPETDETEGKTGGVFCAAGGQVSGGNVSGSFCMGPVDIASGSASTSSGITWQPGPIVKVSP